LERVFNLNKKVGPPPLSFWEAQNRIKFCSQKRAYRLGGQATADAQIYSQIKNLDLPANNQNDKVTIRGF